MSSYSADLIILWAKTIYKLMGSAYKVANCLLRFIKQTMKAFLKKCRNDGRTRPIGLLGTQIGDQKLTGCMRACVNVYIYLYMGVYI